MSGLKPSAQQPREDKPAAGDSAAVNGHAGEQVSDPTTNGTTPAEAGVPETAKANGSKTAEAHGSQQDVLTGTTTAEANGHETIEAIATKPAEAKVTKPAKAKATKPAVANGGEPAGAGGVPDEPGPTPGSSGGKPFRPGIKLIALGAAAVAAITAGVIFAVTQPSGGPAPAAYQPGHAASGPIRVTSILPSANTTEVNGSDPVIVTFSGQVAPNSPDPILTPSVPGSWAAMNNSLVFTPTKPFQPSTQVTVQVPSGPSGVHSAGGGLLTSAVTSQFTTGGYSQAGLAVLLAQQGYLPMTWSPQHYQRMMWQQQSDAAAQTPQGMAYSPPPGTFTWESGYPATLQAQWSPDHANVLLAGAVMAFESEHNMPMNGNLTPRLWNALFEAQARGQRNVNGYTYAIASKGSPETLTIWHNGTVVQHSLANTGIPVSPTVDGTFPVFERFRFQIMSGTNPDGSHYADPVQFVAYFNSGDAVHYFPRGSYGSPQSLGCVELDMSDAQHAWPFLTYGSLVSVVG